MSTGRKRVQLGDLGHGVGAVSWARHGYRVEPSGGLPVVCGRGARLGLGYRLRRRVSAWVGSVGPGVATRKRREEGAGRGMEEKLGRQGIEPKGAWV
jgi:hypothetical protein